MLLLLQHQTRRVGSCQCSNTVKAMPPLCIRLQLRLLQAASFDEPTSLHRMVMETIATPTRGEIMSATACSGARPPISVKEGTPTAPIPEPLPLIIKKITTAIAYMPNCHGCGGQMLNFSESAVGSLLTLVALVAAEARTTTHSRPMSSNARMCALYDTQRV